MEGLDYPKRDTTIGADAMPADKNTGGDELFYLDDECLSNAPEQMTLEAIVDAVGEFEHLNELVVLNIEKSGGLKGVENYFKIVTPILDLLEIEIRVRYAPGITKKRMKLIVQDWIDKEIAELK